MIHINESRLDSFIKKFNETVYKFEFSQANNIRLVKKDNNVEFQAFYDGDNAFTIQIPKEFSVFCIDNYGIKLKNYADFNSLVCFLSLEMVWNFPDGITNSLKICSYGGFFSQSYNEKELFNFEILSE